MKEVPFLSYNTNIKIAGNIVTITKFEGKQFYNYSTELFASSESQMFKGLSQEQKEKKIEEIKEENFKKSSRRAKTKIFDLIVCNVDKHLSYANKKERVKFLTLTFKENITDIEKANEEISKFFKRLSYELFNVRTNVIKYLTVPELQKRGAIHYHIVLFNCPYIQQKKMLQIWSAGGVYINAISTNNAEKVAKYITKYIAKGINVDEEKETTNINNIEENQGEKKLTDYQLYKSYGLENKKRYFCSRGLFKPLELKCQAIDEEVTEILEYLQADVKKHTDAEGNLKNNYNYVEYENEYRGKIKKYTVEVNKLETIKMVLPYIRRIMKHDKKKLTRIINYDWKKIKKARYDYLLKMSSF